jgi:hypothetical protein
MKKSLAQIHAETARTKRKLEIYWRIFSILLALTAMVIVWRALNE